MADLAAVGMHLYFIGYLFAAVNIVACGYLGATEAATWSFVTSLSRGLVAILIFAFILSKLFAMTGIWLAFPAAEAADADPVCHRHDPLEKTSAGLAVRADKLRRHTGIAASAPGSAQVPAFPAFQQFGLYDKRAAHARKSNLRLCDDLL